VLGARNALSDSHYDGEVVVVDNGSTDGSGALAAAAGARVILEPRRGYGNAYLAGLSSARGRYIVMLDADLTYDPSELPRFVQELENAATWCSGTGWRASNLAPCRGCISTSATRCSPACSTGCSELRSGTPICGMRAIRRDILPRLDLRTSGMELASEM